MGGLLSLGLVFWMANLLFLALICTTPGGRTVNEAWDRKYLSLGTYRKSGEGVRRALWFVEEDGVLYAETLSETGKVKRLRREPHVRLVPSDRRGGPGGEWIEGEACLVEGEEAKRARKLLSKKYGLHKRLVGVMYRFMKGEPVIISMQIRRAKPNT